MYPLGRNFDIFRTGTSVVWILPVISAGGEMGTIGIPIGEIWAPQVFRVVLLVQEPKRALSRG
jgi:hypothetical protein